jgi:hypothetical protein
MALRSTEPNEDAQQPRRVKASALPPGFCPARIFTSVRPSWGPRLQESDGRSLAGTSLASETSA